MNDRENVRTKGLGGASATERAPSEGSEVDLGFLQETNYRSGVTVEPVYNECGEIFTAVEFGREDIIEPVLQQSSRDEMDFIRNASGKNHRLKYFDRSNAESEENILVEGIINPSLELKFGKEQRAIPARMIITNEAEEEMKQFYWMPDFVKPAPQMPDYNWLNQGAATKTEYTDGSVFIYNPGAAVDNVRALLKNKTGVYTYEIGMMLDLSFVNFQAAGIILKNSGGNALVTFGITMGTNYAPSLLEYNRWNSITSFANNGFQRRFYSTIIFFKLTIDGSDNRIFSYSNNGRDYIPAISVVNTDWITPNQVGFFIHSSNANQAGITLFHLKET
jgi:hypothetical protein